MPRNEGVVLVWKWSIFYEAVAIGRVGSKAFVAFAVLVVLQAVSDPSHVETDIEYSAGHDRQVFDIEGIDAIKYEKRVVKVKGVVGSLHLRESRGRSPGPLFTACKGSWLDRSHRLKMGK